MTKIRHASLSCITPAHFVRASLRHLGRVDHVDPYWFHAVIEYAVVPSYFNVCSYLVLLVPHNFVASYFIKNQTFVRSRLMKRDEEAKKAQ